MRKLIVLALVGFVAQVVDGSLGMGYGVTSSSLLILAGLTPAAASASVHFSELGTNVASGLSHWKLKNVDWRVVTRIAGPGAIGATILLVADAQGDRLRIAAVILVMLGVLLLTYLLMLVATQVQRLLGVTGLHVVSRIVGVLLAALAVQFILDGIATSGILA